MAIYRRPIRLPVSKLPIRITPIKNVGLARVSPCDTKRISSVPRRIVSPSPPEKFESAEVSISLTLPVPPSINHQYATVNGRRLLSSGGRAYKAQVAQLVWLSLAQSSNRSVLVDRLKSESLALSIRFYFSSALRRDVDGGLKIAQDALCEGLGINDNRIVETHLYKHVDKNNPRIEVSLRTTSKTSPS